MIWGVVLVGVAAVGWWVNERWWNALWMREAEEELARKLKGRKG